MNQLPTEILVLTGHQLGQQELYQCVLVNHRFYDIMTHMLWKTVQVQHSTTMVNFFYEMTMNQQHAIKGRYIQHLTLDLDDISNNYNNKRNNGDFPCIDATRTVFKRTCIPWVAKNCPNLVSLRLDSIKIPNYAYTLIGKHLDRLSRLVLIDCDHLPHDLGTTLSHLPLQQLTVAHFSTFPWDWEPAMMDLTQFKHVTRLQLGGNRVQDLLQKVIDKTKHSSDKTFDWPQLTTLNITDVDFCFALGDDDLVPVLPCLSALTHLQVNHSHRLTNTFLDALVTYVPNLLELDISCSSDGDYAGMGLTPNGFRHLVLGCRRLQSVILLNCGINKTDFSEASDRCSRWVAEGPDVVYRLYRLDQQAIHNIRTTKPKKEQGMEANGGGGLETVI